MTLSDYVYPCAGGESFDSVARMIYGDEKYAAELLCANPELSGRIRFQGGEKLYLPVIVVPDEGEANVSQTAPWKND